MTTTTTGAPAAPSPESGRTGRGRRYAMPAIAIACVVLLGCSLMIGEYHITLAGLLTGDDEMWRMFFISRVPRTVALILAAVAMSFSGVIMMRLTQNRFVEPTTAGTAEWAGLGVLIGLIYFPGASPTVKVIIATAAALAGTLIFLGIVSGIRARRSALVPLVGIMMGAVVGAIATYIAKRNELLQAMTAWRSGGFNSIVQGVYEPLWAVGIVAVGCYLLANYFTIAGLGRDVATSLGLNYALVMTAGVTMVALATGVTSTVVGFIPFLGLVVPNIISALRGDDLRSNLPWIGVLATTMIVFCDIVGRLVVRPMEIPVSVTMGVIGSILFLVIILSGRSRVAL